MAESMKDRLIKKFEDEIATLDRELKLELPREIKRARELGDLRENAEYHAAKERQRLVESRLSMLQKRVAEISLINIDRIPTDRAGFGSQVHVIESTGEKLVFQLVMPEDADAGKGLISTTSPIGRAFLNREEGETIKVVTPGGSRRVRIHVARGREHGREAGVSARHARGRRCRQRAHFDDIADRPRVLEQGRRRHRQGGDSGRQARV